MWRDFPQRVADATGHPALVYSRAAYGLSSPLAAARRHYDLAIALCRARDDRLGLAASLTALTLCAATYQTDTMVAALGLDQAASAGEEALALARQLDWPAGEAYALTFLAFCLGPAGRYGGRIGVCDGSRATSTRCPPTRVG